MAEEPARALSVEVVADCPAIPKEAAATAAVVVPEGRSVTRRILDSTLEIPKEEDLRRMQRKLYKVVTQSGKMRCAQEEKRGGSMAQQVRGSTVGGKR